MLKDIQAIAFDIGDTIINATLMQTMALRETAKMLYKNDWIKDIEKFYKIYMDIDRGYEGPDINHLFSKPIAIMEQALNHIGIKNRIKVYWAVSFYRNKINKNIAQDREFTNLLHRLKNKNKRLGIISDGSLDEQIFTLFRMNILHLFDSIIISEAIGTAKPNPMIFEALITDLGIGPENILIVGDSLKDDIIGGEQSGCKTIWVTDLSKTDTDKGIKRLTITRDKIYTIDKLID